MSGARTGIRIVKLMNSIVDTSFLVLIMLLVVIGCYAIWDSKQVYQGATASSYAVFKPTEENEGKSLEELKAINPEVLGWLSVYGTNIDYPLVQGEENMKYVNTSAEGQYSLSGAIFLDCYCSGDFSDFSTIIYGHHMDRSAMFGDIGNFADKSYFDARRYGMLYYEGRERGLEFFAFVHTDAYDDSVFKTRVIGPEAQQAYLDRLYQLASHTCDLRVTTDDRIVLLSTCSATSTNGRDILIGKITEDARYNPFTLEEFGGGTTLLTVDGLPNLWARIPLWGKIALVALPLLLLILLWRIRRRRTRANSG
jgi:sortase B